MNAGEVRSVLQLCRNRGPLRRWIAAATGFALAVHVVLSAVVIGHFAPSQADAASDTFIICHGAGDKSAPDQDGPVNQPRHQSHCVLCTLTSATCAVLPSVSAIKTFDASMFLQRATLRNPQVTQFDSPTGEYQRGPPTYISIAG
jgi:hypothetical protein